MVWDMRQMAIDFTKATIVHSAAVLDPGAVLDV